MSTPHDVGSDSVEPASAFVPEAPEAPEAPEPAMVGETERPAPALDDEHVLVRGLWRGVDVFRWLALAYATWAVWERHAQVAHLVGAVAILAALTAWTVVQTLRPMRTVRAYATELVIGCGAILATRLVDHPAVITGGAKTIPSIWPTAAVVGFAVLRGWRGGLAAASLVAATSFVEVVHPTANTVSNSIFGLLLGGCIGYCVDLARASHEALAEAMRLDAARNERDRLARTVHDGVLQTLAFINRRAADLGGEAARLGAMAGEQERILRTLVSQSDLAEVGRAVSGDADLRVLLRHVEVTGVQLVSPADAVLLPRRVADEVVAAVEAALDNVRQHAGQHARAWVLLDDDGKDVAVTIRDSGKGVAAGRLDEAVGQGRLGVSSSIRGRLADLGGTATITSGPSGGTTVELRIPNQRTNRRPIRHHGDEPDTPLRRRTP
ncbi:MacS family sensor histidine kinase [Terrabacter terrigena]|uniref:MacS family sensor histidine kinase n=1 Tax=Terrabacter terrigena TaxID=574718 RepID=A0ABW3MX97_9MICO